MKQKFALGGQLQLIALLYTQALIAQTSQTSVCNQHKTKEQQFCRWLLMSIDLLHYHQLFITHTSIAKILGMRRETISEVAAKLQKAGIIACSRGQITEVSILKLKKSACECYRVVNKEYRRLLPTKIKKALTPNF